MKYPRALLGIAVIVLFNFLPMTSAAAVIAPCMSSSPSAMAATTHPAYTNILINGVIYQITDGQCSKAAYTSAAIFLSDKRNSFSTVVPASQGDMQLPTASGFMPPQTETVVCSTNLSDLGTCYMIEDSGKAPFVSAQVFQNLGFNFSHVVYADVSYLPTIAAITGNAGVHTGLLINNQGTIEYMTGDGVIKFPSMQSLATVGFDPSYAFPVDQADITAMQAQYYGSEVWAYTYPQIYHGTPCVVCPG